MKPKRPTSCFEPVTARVTRQWHAAFGDEPPPCDDSDVIARWHTMRAKAEENAEWLLWGSGMFAESVPTGFISGDPVPCDGAHVLARFTQIHTDHPAPPTHGAVAVRFAECVNALRGVGDPAALVAATRDLLSDLCRGETTAADPRVVSLLARWIPAEPHNPVVHDCEEPP